VARCKNFLKKLCLEKTAHCAHSSHMRTKSTNLTLNDGIKEMAREIVEKQHYSSMTALVEELIRNKYFQHFPEDKKGKGKGCPDVLPPAGRPLTTSGLEMNDRPNGAALAKRMEERAKEK
jgi:hypothetical protein